MSFSPSTPPLAELLFGAEVMPGAMKPKFKALFTDHPSHEAITELLDCLQALDDACNAEHLSELQRDNPKQPDVTEPTHSQTTPPEQ